VVSKGRRVDAGVREMREKSKSTVELNWVVISDMLKILDELNYKE
jgi:hypothetical protein